MIDLISDRFVERTPLALTRLETSSQNLMSFPRFGNKRIHDVCTFHFVLGLPTGIEQLGVIDLEACSH